MAIIVVSELYSQMDEYQQRRTFFAQISAELDRAIEKHPNFPDDIVRMVAIMAEEAGEAIQAANDNDVENLRVELIQTAAMCIRCLMTMEQKR